jgi:hypothetical protein
VARKTLALALVIAAVAAPSAIAKPSDSVHNVVNNPGLDAKTLIEQRRPEAPARIAPVAVETTAGPGSDLPELALGFAIGCALTACAGLLLAARRGPRAAHP